MAKENKTLHLVLKRKWWDMIASGEKIEEYREVCHYWATRLLNEQYRWYSMNTDYPKDFWGGLVSIFMKLLIFNSAHLRKSASILDIRILR